MKGMRRDRKAKAKPQKEITERDSRISRSFPAPFAGDLRDRAAPAPDRLAVVVRRPISFSLLAQAIVQMHLPDAPWRSLVSSFGYFSRSITCPILS
jgi:hypothetical protein